MSLRSIYRTKESELSASDQKILQKYREYHDALRKQKFSPLDAPTLSEHLENIGSRGISKATQKNLISELLRYHGWACEEHNRRAHQLRITKIIISNKDLYSYCKFLQDRKVKLWTMNKICQAIISILKFFEIKEDNFDNALVAKMLRYTRALYASISRSTSASLNDRPSLCERREYGEALSFLDIVKVCEAQNWRYRVLLTLVKRNNLTLEVKRVLRELFMKEVERFAVILTLLKYPTRKIEAQRLVIKKVGDTWRLQISAVDRKSSKCPIDVKLNSAELQVFNYLKECHDETRCDLWSPFKGIEITQVLKATTLDMAGIGVTVTSLRSAAESHVDIIEYNCPMQSEKIQKALSYAEGHTDRIAKLFYKRNGSATIMKAWTSYVDMLMNIQEAKTDYGMSDTDKKILRSIKDSQKRWIEKVQCHLRSVQLSPQKNVPVKSINSNNPKRKAKWSAEEDKELRKRVRLYGQGNWKEILDNSSILQERYKTAHSVQNARNALRDRWRNLHKGSSSSNLWRRNPRHEWTFLEDDALELAVSEYGTNWKAILGNSSMFQEIYDHMPVENARNALRDRWRHLLKEDDKKIYPKCNSTPKQKRNKLQVGDQNKSDPFVFDED